MSSVLILGDTLQVLEDPNGLRSPEGKILRADACITDPPYNVSLDGDRKWDNFQRDKYSQPDEDFRDWTRMWARLLHMDVLLPGGLISVFSAARTIHAVVFGLQKADFELIDMALWLYATGQVKHKHILKPAYEPIAIARKKADDLNKLFTRTGRGLLHAQDIKAIDGKHPMNVDIADPVLVEHFDDIRDMAKFMYVAKPSVKERDLGCEELPLRHKEGGISGNALVKRDDLRAKILREHPDLTDAEVKEKMDDVLAGALVRNIHPTVKPIELMRRLVRLLTKPGATVIDPFMGSGTTGIACALEGRHFIGIEREAEFYEIAKARITKAEAEAIPAQEAA